LNFTDNLKDPENNKKCESLLLDLAERDKQYDAEGLERAWTLTRLANCYIRQGPSQYEKAECVLEEARQLGVDPMTGQTCVESRFCICDGLEYLASSRGDFDLALTHLEYANAAAIEAYGEDDALVLACKWVQVSYLEYFERWEEAEEVEDLCQLSDDLDDLSLDGIWNAHNAGHDSEDDGFNTLLSQHKAAEALKTVLND
jgi:tetratricopeptide (TPR) repeat protein